MEEKHITCAEHYSKIDADCANCGERIECRRVARAFNFNLGNAIKYVWRCGFKHDSAVDDLKKAVNYLQDEIARISK